jgi:hypothetical protein
MVISGKHSFYPAGQLTARQKDTMAAGAAFQPNIRAQSNNLPFITAARVGFSQT